MPLDPGRGWLAAGITGLARQREWDSVVTVAGPGEPGAEVEFVALPDGRLVVEQGPDGVDLTPFAESLEDSIEPPYRALAHRRPELWAVGAVRIEVARLDPDPGADELELTWDGDVLGLTADGVPADPSRASALERLAAARESGAYAAHANRLEGDLFELLVLPL
jgi:hypothetical protein